MATLINIVASIALLVDSSAFMKDKAERSTPILTACAEALKANTLQWISRPAKPLNNSYTELHSRFSYQERERRLPDVSI